MAAPESRAGGIGWLGSLAVHVGLATTAMLAAQLTADPARVASPGASPGAANIVELAWVAPPETEEAQTRDAVGRMDQPKPMTEGATAPAVEPRVAEPHVETSDRPDVEALAQAGASPVRDSPPEPSVATAADAAVLDRPNVEPIKASTAIAAALVRPDAEPIVAMAADAAEPDRPNVEPIVATTAAAAAPNQPEMAPIADATANQRGGSPANPLAPPPHATLARPPTQAQARPLPHAHARLASSRVGSAAEHPAAPSAPSSAPPSVDATSPSWNAALAAWLHRNKSYPQAARLRGEEGSGRVRFTVARDGRVLTVELTQPTGSPILDEAVRRWLTGAMLPAFPLDMPQAQVTVHVPIRYTLDR